MTAPGCSLMSLHSKTKEDVDRDMKEHEERRQAILAAKIQKDQRVSGKFDPATADPDASLESKFESADLPGMADHQKFFASGM
jgi:hypothetical protein